MRIYKQYDAVVVAIGAWHSMPMRCKGEAEFAEFGDVARTAVRLSAAKVFTFEGLSVIEASEIEPVAKSAGNVKLMKYPNSQGLADLGVEKYNGESFKGLIIFGEDISDLPVLSNMEFLAVVDAAVTDTVKKAHVALPGATFAEVNGTYTNGTGKVQEVRAAVAAPMGYTPRQWIETLDSRSVPL